jgi:hypothetical protein
LISKGDDELILNGANRFSGNPEGHTCDGKNVAAVQVAQPPASICWRANSHKRRQLKP